MYRRIAPPLLATGLALLALAATILPFEERLVGLAQQGVIERMQTLQSAAVTTLLLALAAGAACWWRPRHVLALLLVAVALGTAGGTAALVVVPELVTATPVQLAIRHP